MVGLTPAIGLIEPRSCSHRARPRFPPSSPPQGCIGLDVTALLSRGHQEQRMEASMPQEGQGCARVGRTP